MTASPLTKEAARICTLRAYQILDTAPEAAFDDLARLAAQICETPIAMVSLKDEKRYWFKARVGLEVTQVSRKLAFCEYVQPNPDTVLIVPDALADPRFATNPLVISPPHIRFYAGTPLIAPTGQMLGTLCVMDRAPRTLTSEQREALGILGRQVEAQLELRRIQYAQEALQSAYENLAVSNERLQMLATTDGLTGLKNHRAFQEQFQIEYERAVRYHVPLSLLLLDVDNFKQYNDAYGHLVGDEILKTIASLLQQTARHTDYVARYGGEEFVVILTDTDYEGALVVGERFRKRVEQHAWDTRVVTGSIGLSTRTPQTADREQMVAEADAALYTSKQAGRNQVKHYQQLKDPRD